MIQIIYTATTVTSCFVLYRSTAVFHFLGAAVQVPGKYVYTCMSYYVDQQTHVFRGKVKNEFNANCLIACAFHRHVGDSCTAVQR